MKIAVIKIRGEVRVNRKVEEALKHLFLPNKNNCVVIEDTKENMSMIRKVKDYVTWGPVSEEAVKLLEKRKHGKNYLLSCPKKGYGRKGTKVAFSNAGGLGPRGDKINDLIRRMV